MNLQQFDNFINEISDFPIEISIILMLSGAFLISVIYIIIYGLLQFYSARKQIFAAGEVLELKIEINETEKEIFKLHTSQFTNEFPVEQSGRALVYGITSPELKVGTGKYIVANSDIVRVHKHQKQNGQENVLEVGRRTLETIFPNQSYKGNVPTRFGFKAYSSGGFVGFWNDEDNRAQYANRATVLITLSILILELLLNDSDSPLRLAALALVGFVFIICLFFLSKILDFFELRK